MEDRLFKYLTEIEVPVMFLVCYGCRKILFYRDKAHVFYEEDYGTYIFCCSKCVQAHLTERRI